MWKVTKKKLGYTLLLACLLLLLSGTCSAQGMYQMTEQELTTLETNLQMYSDNNNQLIKDLELSRQDLQKARNELNILQQQLKVLTVESQKAKQELSATTNSLVNANKSLEKYAKEVKSDRRKLKLQRNILGASLVYVLAKNIK